MNDEKLTIAASCLCGTVGCRGEHCNPEAFEVARLHAEKRRLQSDPESVKIERPVRYRPNPIRWS